MELAAAVSVVGLVVGLLLGAIVYWVLTAIHAPQIVAVLAAVLVVLVCLLGGISI